MKLFLFLFIFSTGVHAGMDIPKIEVQGNCNVNVVPDRGRVTFTAEHQARDQKEAVKKTTKLINTLKENIQSLKLKDSELKNTNYSVFPVREWEKEKMVHKGYRASLSLEVTTSEIPRLGEAMMKASEAGVTNVGSLETFLSHEKARKEYLKCLDIASADAKAKAEQLAKRMDFKIGDVILVIENPKTEERIPQPERSMMKTMAFDAAPTQIEAGTQKFSTTIHVTFKIK